MTQDQLYQLLTAVEQSIGRKMATPRDFELLSESLARRLGEQLSVSTLKRLWGYVSNDFNPSRYTIDVLARFVGYNSWEKFVSGRAGNVPPSDPIMAASLNVSESLTAGARLRLTWAPDRECVVRYLGNAEWTVEQSRNTRLQAGDEFKCGLIIAGEPLYLDDLRQQGRKPTVYVCGQIGGVRYELIEDETGCNG